LAKRFVPRPEAGSAETCGCEQADVDPAKPKSEEPLALQEDAHLVLGRDGCQRQPLDRAQKLVPAVQRSACKLANDPRVGADEPGRQEFGEMNVCNAKVGDPDGAIDENHANLRRYGGGDRPLRCDPYRPCG